MKGQKSVLLFLLALVSLIGIGVVVATGIFQNKPQPAKKVEEPKVLGEEVASNPTPTSAVDVNRFVQSTFQNTKEAAGQKVSEVQKTIVNTVEKEVSNLAKSQVDALKLQICRDWGVLTPAPSKTP